jgi:hypothetical protein
MFITKFLDRKEVRLVAMCIFTTFTASTYVDLIEELELRYGGLNHCFDFVRTKLINGSKLKLNDLTNMHQPQTYDDDKLSSPQSQGHRLEMKWTGTISHRMTS